MQESDSPSQSSFDSSPPGDVFRALETMAECFQLLITQPEVFPAIQQALRVIGESSCQHRAYFFDLRQDEPDGVWLSSQRCEWSDPLVSSQMDNPALQNIPLQTELPRLLELMLSNKIYEGSVREFSPEEQALLNPQGIISLLIMPVFGSRGILGFIGFDNCREEYPWSAVERSMLQGTAAAIGAALDRHESSLLLQESNQRFQRLLDEIPNISVQGYRADGTVVYWNTASEKVYGYSREEAMGKTLYDLIIPEEMQPTVREAVKNGMEGTPIPSEELKLRRKDGSFVSVFSSHSLVRQPGSPPELFCLDVDLSEYKALENQLLSAQKMDSIGQLVGGVAHDFNNLLHIINGYAEIAGSKLEPSHEATASIHEIITAGSRANDLVRQLLTFSRQEVIDPGNLDLNEEIKSTKKMLERLIGEHILFEFLPGKDLENIFADKGQIHQVLMNLCVNARDAMPEGGILSLKTGSVLIAPQDLKKHGVSLPGHYVFLRITDTGCGMSKEVCEKIYDPFFTTKEVGKGTGLGLSTVYGIVKQSKGYITVYSEPGEGTAFEIYLPVSQPLPANPTSPVSENAVPEQGGTETLLVVEDEEMLLKLASYSLSAAGYKVLNAKDGEEAVAVFKEHADEIDLVMMDVVMPRMGGKKAMEEILKLRPALRYLFVSGYSLDAGHNDFIKEKSLHLLNKPYRVKTLLSKIRDILDEPPPKI